MSAKSKERLEGMLSQGWWNAAGENVGCWEERKNGDWGGNGENLELWGGAAELCALGADDEADSAVGVLQIERSTPMFTFISSRSEAVAQITSLNRIVFFFYFCSTHLYNFTECCCMAYDKNCPSRSESVNLSCLHWIHNTYNTLHQLKNTGYIPDLWKWL